MSSICSGFCHLISASLASLRSSPRELFVCFIVKIVDSFAYFALSQIIIIYLHDEFGLTDIQAGAVYGFWGAAVLLWGLATSFINDNIGVRTALLIGYVISFITLLVMAVTTSLAGILVCMFIFLPLGNSMGIPMLTIGIKRFTNRENRAFAFGIFYSCMNIGAVFSGAIVDFFNIGYKEGVPVLGTTISGNRMVVFSCAISVIFSFMVTFLFLRDIKVTERAEAAIDSTKDFEEYKPKQQTFWETLKDLMKSPTFWRFAALSLLLVNLNSVFRYLDALFPTFLVRTFGPDTPKGMIISINPFMIILLTPLVAALTRTYPHYSMIKFGGFVTALSPIFLVFSTSIWASIMFVIVLSLGESIWSPRVYDYTMSVAPDGREASFTALATAPLFAAKIPVGLLSGYLLETYVPEHGRQDPQTMWLIIMCITITSPICVVAFERCVREPDEHTARKLSDASANPLQTDGDDSKTKFRDSKSSVIDYDNA